MKRGNEMSVIENKIVMLREHVKLLRHIVCLSPDDYDTIIHESEEIAKLAYFLKSYKELDKE